MLDNAILERTKRYDLLVRLGVSDPPKVGYLSLNEIDYKTVHEAYQYLCMRFVDDYVSAPSTFALLHKSFLKIARPTIKDPRKDKIDFIPEVKDKEKKKKEETKNKEYSLFDDIDPTSTGQASRDIRRGSLQQPPTSPPKSDPRRASVGAKRGAGVSKMPNLPSMMEGGSR